MTGEVILRSSILGDLFKLIFNFQNQDLTLQTLSSQVSASLLNSCFSISAFLENKPLFANVVFYIIIAGIIQYF
jgi:hypothetical protein